MLRPQPSLSAADRRLLQVVRNLNTADRETLVAFAEFLASRSAPADAPSAEPVPESRPEKESVVAAIRRLRRTYPMLDSGDLLDETSQLMSAHVLQGVAAKDVIDQLEALFDGRYEAHRERGEAGAAPDGADAPSDAESPSQG
jgi:hypothetical protein